MHYKTNTEIFYEAANNLGLTVDRLIVNNKTNHAKFGFYVTYKTKKCYISTKSYFPNVPRWQLALMSDKFITSAVLESYNFPTIKSVSFLKNDTRTLDELKSEITGQPYPILFKPSQGHDGIGIELCFTKSDAETAISTFYHSNTSFLAQPFIEAKEYRIMVVGKEIMFIHRKKFPVIVGDGIQTIKSLLKNAKYSNEAIVKKECEKYSLTPDSILPLGEKLKINITKKSDPDFYINNNFPPTLQKWVEKLCDALSVETVGIDIFANGDLSDTDKLVIIELNSKPSLCYISSYYKDKVTPLNAATKVLKQYFFDEN